MTRWRGLLAAAAVLLGAGAGAATGPAAPARAAAPTHVAIVVAGVGTACVPAGGSGMQLLASAFTVKVGTTQGTAGMVLFINGMGSESTRPDYWSYWRSTGSGWAYSGLGPSGTHPAAGTVEGWAFGSFSETDQPPLGQPDYAALCGSRDPEPASPPAPTRAPAPATTHASTPRTSNVPQAPASPSAASRTTTRSSGPSAARGAAAGKNTTTTRHTQNTATPPNGSTASTAVPPSADAISAPLRLAGSKRSSDGSSPAPAVGTVLGLLAVGGLGTAAFVRSRRQRAGES